MHVVAITGNCNPHGRFGTNFSRFYRHASHTWGKRYVPDQGSATHFNVLLSLASVFKPNQNIVMLAVLERERFKC